MLERLRAVSRELDSLTPRQSTIRVRDFSQRVVSHYSQGVAQMQTSQSIKLIVANFIEIAEKFEDLVQQTETCMRDIKRAYIKQRRIETENPSKDSDSEHTGC